LAVPGRGAPGAAGADRTAGGLAHGPRPLLHAEGALRPDVRARRMIAAAATPPPQPPAAISAALTETTVRVNSDFRGDRIVLYGAVFDPRRRPSDVVVLVRGPDEPIRIARKTRVA